MHILFVNLISHYFQLSSLWDRVVAGATMVVIFAAVSVLLSTKKQLLSVSTVPAVRQHLESVNNTNIIWTYNINFPRFLLPQIPREKTALIVNHALEMWESLGSPMEPDGAT